MKQKHVRSTLNTINDINTLLDENILIGKIAIQLYNEEPKECPVPHEGFVTQQEVCYPLRQKIHIGGTYTYNHNERELEKLDPYPPFKTITNNGESGKSSSGLAYNYPQQT